MTCLSCSVTCFRHRFPAFKREIFGLLITSMCTLMSLITADKLNVHSDKKLFGELAGGITLKMKERIINEDVEPEEEDVQFKEELIYVYTKKENNEEEDPLKAKDVTGHDTENQRPEMVQIKEEPLFQNIEELNGKVSSRKRRKQDISATRNVDLNFDLIFLQSKQSKLDVDKTVLKKRRKHNKEFSSGIYECADCWSTFADAQSLRRHLRSHKTYCCEFCGLKFSLTFYYTCHLRTHTGEKPYSCEFCELKFSQRSNFTRHVKTIHDAKRPFECEFCELKFAVRYRLKRHVITVHEAKRPFKCKFCAMKFATQFRLERHVKSMHMGPHICKYCNRVFSNPNSLKSHARIHSRTDCSEKSSEIHTSRRLRSGKQLSS